MSTNVHVQNYQTPKKATDIVTRYFAYFSDVLKRKEFLTRMYKTGMKIKRFYHAFVQ